MIEGSAPFSWTSRCPGALLDSNELEYLTFDCVTRGTHNLRAHKTQKWG